MGTALTVLMVLALVGFVIYVANVAAPSKAAQELAAFHSELNQIANEKEALLKDLEKLMPPLIEATEKIVRQHAPALGRKLKQLVYLDDYGRAVFDGWERESKYFLENVVLTDPAIASLREELRRKDPSGDEELWFFSGYMTTAPKMIYGHAETEYQKMSSDSSLTLNFDNCSPAEYEQHCAAILETVGWSSRVVGSTGDQGVDVIAIKDGRTFVAQCKKYSSPVGNAAVQEVFAGKQHYAAHFAAVVSNQSYTPAARQIAATTGVLLLHHDQLPQLAELLGV